VQRSGQDAAKSPDDETAVFHLPNDDTAPARARRDVRKTLTGWRLLSIVDDAVLAVSELVTNAVRHGLPPIGLLLRRRTGQVRMEVDDARRDLLVTGPTSGPLDESGRGLDIVREVADHLGAERIPGDGKYVYASWNTPKIYAADPDNGAKSPQAVAGRALPKLGITPRAALRGAFTEGAQGDTASGD
jgi:anti-sigma regulatory factor (Ser/Thr protein kinase)